MAFRVHRECFLSGGGTAGKETRLGESLFISGEAERGTVMIFDQSVAQPTQFAVFSSKNLFQMRTTYLLYLKTSFKCDVRLA